jgi:NAD+ synthase
MVKCGFRKVLLGLSGGIDSAIVATIAADAIGAENVRCVMLPSRFTSEAVAARRGRGGAQSGLPAGHRVDWRAAGGGGGGAGRVVCGHPAGVTEENIQSPACAVCC